MSTNFRPVRGLEVNILNMPYTDGYVYYAIDTHRIYMDANGQSKIPMGGGNSGIYYASKNFTDSSDISFSTQDIEGKELPSVNDLIINYKSGNELRDGFYKVISVNDLMGTVETEYLPVGGGGGGGTGSSGGGKILITPLTPAVGTTTSGEDYWIEYSIEAYNNAEIPVITAGKATYVINGVNIDGGIIEHGGKYSFNVGPYLTSLKDTNTITLKASINTGGVVDDVQTYTWTVKCIDLTIIWPWTYSSNNYIKENTFSLTWSVNSGIACDTHIMIDDGNTLDKDYFIVPLIASQTEASKTFDSFPYGAHKFTMWLTAKIGSETIVSNQISHILTFVQGDDITPILTVPYFTETVTQYDTLNIPFLVYKPKTEKLNVSFYVDDIEVLTDEYAVEAISPHTWPYTISKAGDIKIKIAFSAYPDIYYSTTLQVKPLDLGITEPEATFSLKASEISGNAQLKQLEEDGAISFSENFDWINGGLKTEQDETGNVNNYICVRQGTTMTINYKLFENSQVGTQGKNLKFCFKAMNCYDYNAPVLECYDEGTALGLKFNAQQALFSSVANQNFTTQYCEGQYIELETEIWPNQADSGNRPGDRFLMFWVDGVPAGVQVFGTDDSFIQGDKKFITIGSNQCDVYIYILKIYERKLSELEHLNNFILDAPNVNEKLARYTRNDILSSNGEISYEKLVTKNPGCHAYLYKLTENGMTTGKDDEKYCDYTEYYLNTENPYITANKAKVFVQGTSSAAYGVAAFNVRTDFGDTIMYDGEGNVIEGRKVSDTSIPVDYTCTKVNVASCEGVNNALNQEWYNRFQPYYDGHRRKSTANKQYRDCMEFDFGVMFIEDHNQATDYLNNGVPDKSKYTSTNVFAYDNNGNKSNSYLANPYYKQYAVANMGNDKKNLEVFHDTQNPKACCVEVLDNQNAQHWMTVNVTTDDFVWSDGDTGFYEFRYSVKKCKGENPDGITEQQQAQAFINFVNWMASCDPSPKSESHPNGYTNEDLEEAVTYTEKIFTGFIPEGWDNTTSSGITLAGFGTKKYAGTYTKDTKEYRIAKMLAECEEHLVMDSVVYHYLFIQRHTMVDNVAKNTFWSTEDLQHWDLTKNYDNDTSDGNDNSGYLRYSYGKEILDPGIFNASDSVWLNFIYNIPDVQEELYKKLLNRKINSVGVWDATGYLKLFKEKQRLIPERCWIYDYFRKYIRPRRLGLDADGTFIQRLEGGLKTHQRNQYETYQSYYIDSKYCAGPSFNDSGSLDMRLNNGGIYKQTTDTKVVEGTVYYQKIEIVDSKDEKKTITVYTRVEITDLTINPQEMKYYELISGGWTKQEKFPVKYYIDLYPSAHIGGQIWRGGRTNRGAEGVAIPIGEILDAPNDATCYIYAANMIQSITGISDTYPNYIGISSAIKLRELEAGSDEEGYHNDKLNRATLNQNTQLEKAQLQQVGSSNLEGLDLSDLVMLKELKINGSTFPNLKLAQGGIIHTLYLNPLTSLNVKELGQLEDFQYDEEIFDTLKDICIQDCPKLNNFGYQLAKGNISRFCFNGVEWTVPISDITIGEEEININVLDNLLQENKLPLEVIDKSLALTGKLIINLTDDLAESAFDEFDIYNTYNRKFPKLQITYTGNLNALDEAHTITFYNDVDKDIIYQVKTNDKLELGYLTSVNGPTGIKMEEPKKESDKIYDYIWNETWKDELGNIYTNEDLMSSIPTTDKTFTAQYDSIKRTYVITLKDYDNSIIEHNISNQEYKADITDLMPIYMYRQNTKENMRYEFQGWISAKDYLSGKEDVKPITEFIVEGDTTYYAFYKEQNYLTTASRMDYFEFSDSGTAIHLKNKYLYLIREPITLPLYNGSIAITQVGSFGVDGRISETNEVVQIPAIYFVNNGINGAYTKISTGAFFSQKDFPSKLEKISIPATITTIEAKAFQYCTNLKTIGLSDDNNIAYIGMNAFQYTGNIEIDLDKLTKLSTIMGSAFYRGGEGVILNAIPSNLKKIGTYVFTECPNVNISDFTTLTSIGQNAFQLSGKLVNTIMIDANTAFGNNVFKDYGVSSGLNVTVVNGTLSDEELSRIGLSGAETSQVDGGI